MTTKAYEQEAISLLEAGVEKRMTEETKELFEDGLQKGRQERRVLVDVLTMFHHYKAAKATLQTQKAPTWLGLAWSGLAEAQSFNRLFGRRYIRVVTLI